MKNLDHFGLDIITRRLRTGEISPGEVSGVVDILVAEALWGQRAPMIPS